MLDLPLFMVLKLFIKSFKVLLALVELLKNARVAMKQLIEFMIKKRIHAYV